MYCCHMVELRIKLVKEIVEGKRKVQDVSELLDVSRQSISKWIAKYRFEGEKGLVPKKSGPKKGSSVYNKTPENIEDLVCKIARNNVFEGPIWISEKLEEKKGINLNQSTVYRILKRTKTRYYRNYRYSKRKKKRYCLDQPGRELQLDVHFPFGYERKDVMYDAIDDCSRFVEGKVMHGHNIESSIKFVEYLISKVPFKIEAIRTDQGKEFHKRFTKYLETKEIEHKKNPAYTPQHNGKIERYHRTFKENEGFKWGYDESLDQLNYRLKLWLNHYNYKKKHSGLGMNRLTPVQKLIYVYIQNSLSQNVNLTLQQNIY